MTDKPQVDKFKELARALDADESDGAFEEALTKVVHAPKLPADDATSKAGETRLRRNWREE